MEINWKKISKKKKNFPKSIKYQINLRISLKSKRNKKISKTSFTHVKYYKGNKYKLVGESLWYLQLDKTVQN